MYDWYVESFLSRFVFRTSIDVPSEHYVNVSLSRAEKIIFTSTCWGIREKPEETARKRILNTLVQLL